MEFIEIEHIEKVLKIKLNRPHKYNSFNKQMALELQEALNFGEKENAIRAILITAEGKSFALVKI